MIIIIVEIIATLVGISLALVIESGLESEKRGYRKFTIGIIGATIGAIFPLLFIFPYRYEEFSKIIERVDSSIKETNDLYSAKSEIGRIENQRVKALFNNEFNKLNEKVNLIKDKQTVHIEGSDVSNVWRKIIEKSKEGDVIRATNIVSFDSWGEFDITNGESVQKKAINRGTKITRIYFYDEKVKYHKQYTDTLYKRDLKNKIEAYQISYSVPKTNRYDNYYNKLNSYDIVLLNNEILLITFTDDKHKIKYSYLTYNREYIDVADKYFNKLLNEIKENE